MIRLWNNILHVGPGTDMSPHLVLSVQGTALLDECRDDLSVPYHCGTMQSSLIPLQNDVEAGTGVSSPHHPSHSTPSLRHRTRHLPYKADWSPLGQGGLCGLVSRQHTPGREVLFSGNLKPTAEQSLAAELTSGWRSSPHLLPGGWQCSAGVWLSHL